MKERQLNLRRKDNQHKAKLDNKSAERTYEQNLRYEETTVRRKVQQENMAALKAEKMAKARAIIIK